MSVPSVLNAIKKKHNETISLVRKLMGLIKSDCAIYMYVRPPVKQSCDSEMHYEILM